ncbi:MAG: hypothetical protein IK147_02330 [Clostridia bacterium]|nr:hypothetical protein [Clostridia bacterium]
MRTVVQDNVIGHIIYEENFWTGKKNLTVNGKPLKKTSRTTFCFEDGTTATLKGGFFSGAKVTVKNVTVNLISPPKWYEIAIAIFMLAFVIAWGNSPRLCEIFPIVGGAIGGGISGIFAMLSVLVMKRAKNPLIKVLIGIVFFAVLVLVLYLIAMFIIDIIT